MALELLLQRLGQLVGFVRRAALDQEERRLVGRADRLLHVLDARVEPPARARACDAGQPELVVQHRQHVADAHLRRIGEDGVHHEIVRLRERAPLEDVEPARDAGVGRVVDRPQVDRARLALDLGHQPVEDRRHLPDPVHLLDDGDVLHGHDGAGRAEDQRRVGGLEEDVGAHVLQPLGDVAEGAVGHAHEQHHHRHLDRDREHGHGGPRLAVHHVGGGEVGHESSRAGWTRKDR